MNIRVPLVDTPERLREWISDADKIHALKGREKPDEYPVPVITFDTGVGFAAHSEEEIVYLQDTGEHLLELFGCLLMAAFSRVCESWERGENPETGRRVIAEGLRRIMEEHSTR